MAPMSLTPRSRFTSDSHRSPRGAATATARPTRMPSEKESMGPNPTIEERTTTTRTATTQPPSNPSTVLFGLAGERAEQTDPEHAEEGDPDVHHRGLCGRSDQVPEEAHRGGEEQDRRDDGRAVVVGTEDETDA